MASIMDHNGKYLVSLSSVIGGYSQLCCKVQSVLLGFLLFNFGNFNKTFMLAEVIACVFPNCSSNNFITSSYFLLIRLKPGIQSVAGPCKCLVKYEDISILGKLSCESTKVSINIF